MPIFRKARHVRYSRLKTSFIKKNQTAAEVRGDLAEERFESMVKEMQYDGRLPWLQGMARASLTEDWIKGIDFKMRVISESESGSMEFSILFQIKSSLKGAEDFKKNNRNPNIHLIVMNDRMNRNWLLSILDSIYLSEVEKHNHPTRVK